MADYFMGEIRVFGFEWAPVNWALCDGARLPIQQNQALYALVAHFGTDSKTFFNLPDLRGRVPIHAGGLATVQGQAEGVEAVRVAISQTPPHSHGMLASTQDGTTQTATNKMIGTSAPAGGRAAAPKIYGQGGTVVALNSGTIASNGGAEGHANMQPFAVVNFCIALAGVYPPQS